MRRAHHRVGLAFATLLSASQFGAPALAQDAAGAQTACERDVRRLCSGSGVPDERRIVACLLPDRTRLSPACQHSAQPRVEPITVAASEVRSVPQR